MPALGWNLEKDLVTTSVVRGIYLLSVKRKPTDEKNTAHDRYKLGEKENADGDF